MAVRIHHKFVCFQYHLFTMYGFGEVKESLHCSRAAEHICAQISFLDGQLIVQMTWLLLCTISHELFKHQWLLRTPGSWNKSNFPLKPFCLKLMLLPPLYGSFFIVLFQPPLWLLRIRSHCCIAREELPVWQCQDNGAAG